MTHFCGHGMAWWSDRCNRSRSGATRRDGRRSTRPKPLGSDLFIETIGFRWQPVRRTRQSPEPAGARGAPRSGSPPRSPVYRPTGRTRVISAVRLPSRATRQLPASSPHGTSLRLPSSPCRPVPRNENHPCPRGRSPRVRSRGPGLDSARRVVPCLAPVS